jgi:molybdopterin synthase catalytic subunit
VILLTREPIDLAALHAPSPADGAVCVFAGVVRDTNAGRRVRFLEYEAYEEMALGQMQELAAEARRRWPVSEVRLVHRLGRLEIGEASVAVAAAAPHRAEAFEACRFLIDTLKRQVPIWKKEHFEGGACWVEGPPAARAAGGAPPGLQPEGAEPRG